MSSWIGSDLEKGRAARRRYRQQLAVLLTQME